MNIKLNKDVAGILKSLAEEDGVTEEVFLKKLIVKEDSDRHVVWSRKKRAFVRSCCSKPDCKEKEYVDPLDIAD